MDVQYELSAQMLGLLVVALVALITSILVPMLKWSTKQIIANNTAAMVELNKTVKEFGEGMRDHRDRIIALEVKNEMREK